MNNESGEGKGGLSNVFYKLVTHAQGIWTFHMSLNTGVHKPTLVLETLIRQIVFQSKLPVDRDGEPLLSVRKFGGGGRQGAHDDRW